MITSRARMPRPFAPPGTRTDSWPTGPSVWTTSGWSGTSTSPTAAWPASPDLTLTVRRNRITAVTLDAVDLEVASVTLDGRPAPFHHDGERLRIEFAGPPSRGDDRGGGGPVRLPSGSGALFRGPGRRAPRPPAPVLDAGTGRRLPVYWPCIDQPIEKFTSEVICTVPVGTFVLSNGVLHERTEVPGSEGGQSSGGNSGNRVRWHYRLDFPHPAYLVTLVAGPFVELVDRAAATGVDVYYYVAPGRESDGRRTFARTPQMIDFFSERIGLAYPHTRYSQITVPEFIFGGMENTTATTLTDLALLDERAALDHDMDGLVSHELAHQWWGDLLTCREWSEAWLNEGFATYFEYVWREHHKGRDEADLELLVDTDGYLAEAGRYQRPVVCRQYEEPIHLFDAHLYEKGGRVLHMLRHELGDGRSGAPSPTTRANTRAGRWRRATWRAPWKRPRGATWTRSSIAGSLDRVTRSSTGGGSGTRIAKWACCASPRRRR